MSRKSRLMVGMVALAVLAGCGNNTESEMTKVSLGEAKTIVTQVFSRKSKTAQSARDPSAVIAQVIRELPGVPLQSILYSQTGAFSVASVYGQNRGVTTWVTRDRRTVSFDGPMLTATRGLGNDLMAVEDGGAVRLIATRQAGTVQKEYRFLDGEDHTNRFIVTCKIMPGETEQVTNGRISASTRVVRERCENGGFKVDNAYWVDGAGRVLQSVQWAGPSHGQLVFRRVQ